jgi:hypothetical protein
LKAPLFGEPTMLASRCLWYSNLHIKCEVAVWKIIGSRSTRYIRVSIILYGYQNIGIGYWSNKTIKSRFKEILTELCDRLEIAILEGVIASDHVHIYVSVPLKHFPLPGDDNIEGQECRTGTERSPGTEQQIPRSSPIGTRLLCQYYWYR